MVKVKNFKSKTSAPTGPRNVNKSKKINPFEVHVNRQKHVILGRKLKNDKGLPGVARAKAIKKRKATLLQEYKIKHKANEFIDRRIGERNRDMTAEDRITARFTAERARSKKKSIFNLADDEVLTHKGQTLNEIEKFDDPRSDDEDDEDRGRLEADFVGDVHFGGGFLRRKEDTENSAQSRQNLIQQLISESKKRKAEKQHENEKTAALTDKLDAAWKDLQPIVLTSKKNSKTDEEESTGPKPKMDSYDLAVRELKFEARGKPSDRLKSEDEIALEEKERLERLEEERVRRMHGVDVNKSTIKHRSADDLDDGFEIEEPEETLSYNDEGRIRQAGTDMMEDDDAPDVDDQQAEEAESESEESSEEESDDDLCDLRYSDGEDEIETANVSEAADGEVHIPMSEPQGATTQEHVEKVKADLQAWKLTMEQARQELPYVFEVPETYEKLQEVMSNKEICKQSVVLERMIKCTHPSLGAGNKERLNTLFAFILQWLHDSTLQSNKKNLEVNPSRALLNAVLPHLFDIAQLTGAGNARRCVAAILTEKYEEWTNEGANKMPGYDTLIFLQLVPHLFPTSDFRHPVVSPAVVMMASILTSGHLGTLEDVCRGLRVCQTLLQYTAQSNRFLPECFKFLTSILTLTMPGKPFDKVFEEFSPDNTKDNAGTTSIEASCVQTKEGTLNFPHVLDTTLSLLLQMVDQLKGSVPMWHSLIAPALEIVSHIPSASLNRYPKSVLHKIASLKSQAVENTKLDRLIAEKKKPKPLKMFEPAIERVIDGKRPGKMSEKKLERMKLKHKYKREMKGAIREIRQDRSFLAKLKLKETMRSDAERREKVKQIMGSLATQAGECNKLDRKRKNKK